MQDALLGVAIGSLAGLLIITMISLGLKFFVALRSPPTQRAAWTAGLSYILTTMVFVFGGVEGYEWAAPLVALPGALIVFWFWRKDFRRGWVDDPERLADGRTLQNDDWLTGLLQLLGLFAVAALAAYVRWLRNS